jgi:L-aspartate oxidase
VSRAIVAELRQSGQPHVFLDLTHLDGAYLRERFPRIYETCLRYGIEMTEQPVPVHPAAHYAMGGVKTNLDGLTTLPRLFAAGEAACTGVHGANRLASNSLLEGVVFGARAGAAMRSLAGAPRLGGETPPALFPEISMTALRRLAWDQCGLVRSAAGLRAAIATLESCPMAAASHPRRGDFERRNVRDVAALIARCALAREESRGGHYREDFPEKRVEFQKHSIISVSHEPAFV